uniref:Chromosome 16 open reading frame 89 n=1 Tax=Sphaeramia orbicularis TaxID=375764 RepID=A0A672YKV9_9TELE
MRTLGLQVAAVLALLAAVNGAEAEVIDDILNSLSRGAVFLERQHEHINLDGVVGFLMLQAELKEAIRTWPHTDPVSWAQRTTAVSLVKRLDQSFDKAVVALQQNDPKYYRVRAPAVLDFWLIPHGWSSTDPSLVYPSTMTTECYDEQLSDKCLTLLLGTWKMNGTPCTRHQPCRDTMTRFGCPHYSLSHQLKAASNLLKGDTRPRSSCSNMMKTNLDIIRDGLTEQTVDIFIENSESHTKTQPSLYWSSSCGLAGFSDFYKADCCITSCVSRRGTWLFSHMTAVAVGALGGYLNYYLTEQDSPKGRCPERHPARSMFYTTTTDDQVDGDDS